MRLGIVYLIRPQELKIVGQNDPSKTRLRKIKMNHPAITSWPFFLKDKKLNCITGIGVLTLGEYLDKIQYVYKDNGGIEGQRAALKTKTGITIRNRMIDDLKNGAVLPPIVIGAVLTKNEILNANKITNNDEFREFIKKIPSESMSIIDGMQRTTALNEARKYGLADSAPLRVELWLSESISSLIYRMLVLNTGQVPWDIKRQLETIYKQIVDTVKIEVNDIQVLAITEKERRSEAGTYRSTRIVELFLAFTSRTPHIELKEKVAADFARMDATEVTSHTESLPLFTRSIKLLAALDYALSRFTLPKTAVDEQTRFKEGKDIFTSAPGSIGFVAAIAQLVLGKPGYAIDFPGAELRMQHVEKLMQSVIDKANVYTGDFVDFLTLNEKVSRRSGRIGEFERDFFFKAFERLLADSEKIDNLEPCWHAHQ